MLKYMPFYEVVPKVAGFNVKDVPKTGAQLKQLESEVATMLRLATNIIDDYDDEDPLLTKKPGPLGAAAGPPPRPHQAPQAAVHAGAGQDLRSSSMLRTSRPSMPRRHWTPP